MAEVQLNKLTKQMLDLFRTEGLRGQDVALALASLIYLRWADFQEAELEAMAQFDETDYESVFPANMHWRYWHQLPPTELTRFFSDRLHPALERNGNSRHNPLATHLHRIADGVLILALLPPRALDVVIHWLADQPFETPNDRRKLLDAYDAILDQTIEKSSGEFRTPAVLARVMVELASPKVGERVYDPCFGTAGLLTAAYDYVQSQGKEGFARHGDSVLDVYGVELNSPSYTIGLTRLVLAGIDDPQIELGNSLERTPNQNLKKSGFDVIISDLPMGMRIPPTNIGYHFPVRTSDATGLFIQHVIAHLRGGGRAVLLVPEGFLFRGGPERQLRKYLAEQHRIEAIISLPSGALISQTSAKASILVLRRDGSTSKIRMVDGSPYFDKKSPTTSLFGIATGGIVGAALSGPVGAMIGLLAAGLTNEVARRKVQASISPMQQLIKEVRGKEPSNNSWDISMDFIAGADWDFSVRRRDQSSLPGFLNSLRDKIEILSLEKLCEFFAGVNVKSNELLD